MIKKKTTLIIWLLSQPSIRVEVVLGFQDEVAIQPLRNELNHHLYRIHHCPHRCRRSSRSRHRPAIRKHLLLHRRRRSSSKVQNQIHHQSTVTPMVGRMCRNMKLEVGVENIG